MSLCYHYIRPKKNLDPFPRLLGIKIDEFKEHISMIQKNFKMISLQQAEDFSHNKITLGEKLGMLITFDDGLSDHFTAAKILEKEGIKGVFFIPSCISIDNLPANPIIIHYALEIFGIARFIEQYEKSLKKFNIEKNTVKLTYISEKNDPWKIIDKIKSVFKYEFSNNDSRKILLDIYENMIFKKNPKFMETAHLTDTQIQEMIEMGHSIGYHTHSHISVAASSLNSDEFTKEMISSKKMLEKKFNIKISSFSYPYGEKKDCLSTQKLLKNTNEYKLAFTVEPKINDFSTSPFELGRYEPYSNDTTSKLKKTLMEIIKR